MLWSWAWRDTVRLGAAGIHCGRGLQGYAANGQGRGHCRYSLPMGAARIFFGGAVQRCYALRLGITGSLKPNNPL